MQGTVLEIKLQNSYQHFELKSNKKRRRETFSLFSGQHCILLYLPFFPIITTNSTSQSTSLDSLGSGNGSAGPNKGTVDVFSSDL